MPLAVRNEFCTLFDLNYLARGLVLYDSLARTCTDFRLRVFCMDDSTKRLLDALALPHLTAIALRELEEHDPGLLAVKPQRTQGEYCWTSTPAICRFALEREPGLGGITYLDADLMFFRDPGPVFDELGDASVLVTPHRYAPRWQHNEAASGIYNVQFVTFRRDERGLGALHWWHARCLEWCYDRVEDGKFGDQKYLDDWPERFAGVHVLQHPGGGLAPWNAGRYALAAAPGGGVLVDGAELVFHHYHGLRLLAPGNRARAAALLLRDVRRTPGVPPLLWSSAYPLGRAERSLVWDPYLRRLEQQIARVQSLDAGFDGGLRPLTARDLGAGCGARLLRAGGRLLGAARPAARAGRSAEGVAP